MTRLTSKTVQIATLVAIAVGILLGMWPSLAGGHDQAAVANAMPTPFVPAGYAFSIWGLIFAGHAAFALYQALPSARRDPVLARVRAPAALNALLSAAWTVSYTHLSFTLAWLIMLAILASLIILAVRLGRPTARRNYWLAYAPYHLNLGWIAVAAMANTAQFLRYQLGWSGAPLPPVVWSAILIATAAALAIGLVLRRHDIPFGAVVVWALIAVAIEHASLRLVEATAIVAAALVVMALQADLAHRHLAGPAVRSSRRSTPRP